MPQFAKLLARGSCACCPTKLAGHFCFPFFRGNGFRLLSGSRCIVKTRAQNGWLRRTLAALLFGTLASCAVATAGQVSSNSTSALSFRIVTDETGRTVRIPVPVRRVVSLSPNMTESLFALGMDDLLVGDTDYCDYPEAATGKHRVGGIVNPSLEEIASLKPDLVLVTKLNRLETVQALERLGIASYSGDPRSLDEIRSSVHRLAEVLGNPAAGQALDDELRKKEVDLQRRLQNVPAKRVLFVVWTDPLISTGKGTFIADALKHAGAISVVESSQDWPQISLEEMVRLQPEFLVFASGHSEAVNRDVDALAKRPGWDALEAVKHKKIAVISDAVNRPAPRLFSAVDDLARQLHPEAFPEKSAISNTLHPAEKN